MHSGRKAFCASGLSEIPEFALRTVSDNIAPTTEAQRFNMLVVGVFATFAIVLALSGLYSALAPADLMRALLPTLVDAALARWSSRSPASRLSDGAIRRKNLPDPGQRDVADSAYS